MKVDLGFIVSIGTSIVLVAATWGALQAKVRFLCQRMDDLKDEKASSEKINSIFEKLFYKLNIYNKIITYTVLFR